MKDKVSSYMEAIERTLNKHEMTEIVWMEIYNNCFSVVEQAIKDHTETMLPIKELSDIEKER